MFLRMEHFVEIYFLVVLNINSNRFATIGIEGFIYLIFINFFLNSSDFYERERKNTFFSNWHDFLIF